MAIPSDGEPIETLAPGTAADLVAFARACRSALHAVALYPPEHPATGQAVARLTEVSARATRAGPLRVEVFPTELRHGGRRLARPDTAASDLAALLHAHQAGELTLGPGIDGPTWRRFLALVARAPEDVRDQGGLSRAWAAGSGGAITLREIDYSEILRARPGEDGASWEAVIAHCLQGEALHLDQQALETLAGILGDPERLKAFARQLEEQAAQGSGERTSASVLLVLLTAVAQGLGAREPERMEAIYGSVAAAASHFSPETMLEWLGAACSRDPAGDGANVAGAVVSRMDDRAIAEFVSRAIIASGGATSRLAEAFGALVPDVGHRHEVLDLAEPSVAASPLGRAEGFELLWRHAQLMLASYSDQPFVPADYARDLDHVQDRSREGEQIGDDPPDRVTGWLGSVSDAALRALDLQMLLELLAVESEPVRWRDLARLVGSHVGELVLVGDFHGAARLLEALTNQDTWPDRDACAPVVADILERLIEDRVVPHLVFHLQGATDGDFEQARRVCLALGAGSIQPLAEALAVEERARARQRLTDALLGFGALGRQSVELLKQSANASVRRTAIHLLSAFGGDDALPDLEALLDDSEPQVQRAAVRAILTIGSEEAYDVLQRAFTSGSDRSHAAILQHLQSAADERLAPLLCYVVRHTDYRGRLQHVYLKAIAALGELGGADEVEALGEALHRGEWWAPGRNARLRGAAGRALRRAGTPRALAILEEAVAGGSRGVRAAARGALADRPRGPRLGGH